MRRTLLVSLAALSIVGCVNKVSSQRSFTEPGSGIALGIPALVPESTWGKKFYRMDPHYKCADESAPGYRTALYFTNDHQILEVDGCSQSQSILGDQGVLEISGDGQVVGHKDRLFQLRQDPKSTSEAYVEGFCSNSFLQADGEKTPVEMRLNATTEAGFASFSWVLKGEHYITLVTDSLKMARAQTNESRIYTAGPESGGVSIQVSLTPDPSIQGMYPASYKMENGVAIDLHCRLSQ